MIFGGKPSMLEVTLWSINSCKFVQIQSSKTHICNKYASQLWCDDKTSTMRILNMSYKMYLELFSIVIEGVAQQQNWREVLSNRLIMSYEFI